MHVHAPTCPSACARAVDHRSASSLCCSSNSSSLQVMGYMSFGWGAGTIVGPVAGGLLALPCDKFPSWMGSTCSDGGLFRSFPYLLPCLLAACAAMTSFAATLFLLNETLASERQVQLFSCCTNQRGRSRYQAPQPYSRSPSRWGIRAWWRQRSYRDADKMELVELQAACDSSLNLEASETVIAVDRRKPHTGSYGSESDEDRTTAEAPPGHDRHASVFDSALEPTIGSDAAAASAGQAVALPPRLSCDASISMGHIEHVPCASREGSWVDARGLPGNKHCKTSVADAEEVRLLSPVSASRGRSGAIRSTSWYSNRCARGRDACDVLCRRTWSDAQLVCARMVLQSDALLRRCLCMCNGALRRTQPLQSRVRVCRSVVLLICGYGLIAFMYNLLDETVPIYASTPLRHNGLALDSNQLGVVLSIGGIALMLAAVLVYPRVQKSIGSFKCV